MRLAELAGPQDLRSLSVTELNALAAEIRAVLVESLGPQGGHLAPNLGTVELTLALHTVLESPRDKILFDVSHQCYSHKLLTNRYRQFHTIRKYGGLAGYTNPPESEHDHFHWGHAGTALSAAVGLAKGSRLGADPFHVVAVVGDGAFTSGMVYEALNHAGEEQLPLVLLLNDNGMSIAPNVGALRHCLAAAGTPGAPSPAAFFGPLGWTYLGPVDGHDIAAVQAALREALSRRAPVVLHARTIKGKGYEPAEANPRVYHGVGAYDPTTGARRPSSGPPTYSEVFAQTVTQLAQYDPRIVAVTAAMPDGTGLAAMAKALPDRLIDVGIAEQHATTLCAGLAKSGMRPVLALYSTFMQRGYDQLIHDVALQNLPVLIALDRAGLVEDGATHQGVFDLAYLRCLPNMTVMAPRDEDELRHMLYTGLQVAGPVAIRYPRTKGLGVPLSPELRQLPIGKGEVLLEGDDLAIFAVGSMVQPAFLAAQLLSRRGISAAVINARFVKPIDEELVRYWAYRTRMIVTVEEAAAAGGYGSAVAELVAAEDSGCMVQRLGIPDRFMPHGDPSLHRRDLGLDEAGIAETCMEIVRQWLVPAQYIEQAI